MNITPRRERDIRTRILRFLLLLFVVAVTPPIVSLVKLSDTSHGRQVNVAGRQRMLSQRITKEALMLAHGYGDHEAIRTSLQENANLFERAQRGLINGDAELELPPAGTPESVAQLNKVLELWGGFSRQVEVVLTAEDYSDPAVVAAVEFLSAKNPELLVEANKAVGLLETGSPRTGLMAVMQGAIVAIAVLLTGVWLLMGRSVVRPLSDVVRRLQATSGLFESNASRVSSASLSVSHSATEQASSLEETAASLEEMSSITSSNAENAAKANDIASGARRSASDGQQSMTELITAMSEITASSAEMAKIVKNIEGIAFQTNLLALNAAVEAARAGEHGKGFAVVAEEVRNLAQRAAEAARNTGALIDETGDRVDNGMRLSEKVGSTLQTITSSTHEVADLISEIATAGAEISQGIDQINRAVTEMDQVTQSNARGAEDSANAANELRAESDRLLELTGELSALIGGTVGASPDTTGSAAPGGRFGDSSRIENGSTPFGSVDATPSLVQSPGSRMSATSAEAVFPMDSGGFDEF